MKIRRDSVGAGNFKRSKGNKTEAVQPTKRLKTAREDRL